MKEKVRFFGLVLLGIHHIYIWMQLAKPGRFKSLDAETLKKLLPLKEHGWRFLTNWNFFFQTLHIFVALITILAPKGNLIRKLERLNWYHFWSIVFPYTIYIPLSFWGIYIYDRELIFPEINDKILPMWLNHGVHTNILLLLVLELATNYTKPPVFKKVFRICTIHSLVYAFILEFTHLNNNYWLYPFLNFLNLPQRIIYFAFTYCLLIGITWAGVSYQNHKCRSIDYKSR